MAQWESELLITFKIFPRHYPHYPRLSHAGKKNILHLQTHKDLLPLLFSFSHQNYVRFLTRHHVELTNLSITKALVLELVSAEINFQLFLGTWSLGPLNSINAENDFIINTHLLAKLS